MTMAHGRVFDFNTRRWDDDDDDVTMMMIGSSVSNSSEQLKPQLFRSTLIQLRPHQSMVDLRVTRMLLEDDDSDVRRVMMNADDEAKPQ